MPDPDVTSPTERAAAIARFGMSPEAEKMVADALADLTRERDEAWKEATIAWAVCASIHREYAKGKDPFFTTRQGDFVKHENDCRAKIKGQTNG